MKIKLWQFYKIMLLTARGFYNVCDIRKIIDDVPIGWSFSSGTKLSLVTAAPQRECPMVNFIIIHGQVVTQKPIKHDLAKKNPWFVCKLASMAVSSIVYYYVLYYALDLVAPICDVCMYYRNVIACNYIISCTCACMPDQQIYYIGSSRQEV